MAASTAPSSVKVGDHIKFSIADDSVNVYTGTVVGVASFQVAKSMGTDLAARHEQVRAALTAQDKSDISSVVDQQFLIVDIGDIRPLVIAFEWITGGAVEVIELGATYTIKLVNTSKEKAQEALNILRANGISCKLNVLY